uniref:Uncharacterized protein n=1 Tax=Romanomermis culicivorax TaxID=13658 RepID=A0A915L274_ROMCU
MESRSFLNGSRNHLFRAKNVNGCSVQHRIETKKILESDTRTAKLSHGRSTELTSRFGKHFTLSNYGHSKPLMTEWGNGASQVVSQ